MLIQNIKIDPPEKDIFYRLGYKKDKTKLSTEMENLVKSGIKKGMELINPKAVYETYNVLRIDEEYGLIELTDTEGANFQFKSFKLSHWLLGSKKATLLAVTIGPDVEEKVREYFKNQKETEGVILDAFGSESAEAVAEYVSNIISLEAKKYGFKTTKRFSPGYGDWHLSAQKEILERLSTNKIGITTNSAFILIPEKSVTAIIGWSV